MIYLDVTGRCGNQMFQYAFAKKLQKLNPGQSLHISFYHVERWHKQTCDDTFSDQLRHFRVGAYTSSVENVNWLAQYGDRSQARAFRHYGLMRKIAYRTKWKKLYAAALHMLNRNGIYREDESLDNRLLHTAKKNIFAKGYFENNRFFDDIREELLAEFTPKYEKPEKNQPLYDIIENRESVCVSFRNWSEVSEDVAKKRDVCGKSYYEQALDRMHELFPDCVFVVFSNDVEWVRQNFKFQYPVVFEDGTDEVWEKLRLMYSCKHFILAPSTFAWWAQYLGRNPEKTVIAPKQWYQDSSTPCHFESEKWIRI